MIKFACVLDDLIVKIEFIYLDIILKGLYIFLSYLYYSVFGDLIQNSKYMLVKRTKKVY